MTDADAEEQWISENNFSEKRLEALTTFLSNASVSHLRSLAAELDQQPADRRPLPEFLQSPICELEAAVWDLLRRIAMRSFAEITDVLGSANGIAPLGRCQGGKGKAVRGTSHPRGAVGATARSGAHSRAVERDAEGFEGRDANRRLINE